MLNTINKAQYSKQNSPAFGNGAFAAINNGTTKLFQTLQNTPVLEIFGIDATTMIIPRTVCDYQQNPVYGAETFARESLAAIPNPFLPGIIASIMIARKGYKGLYANSTTLSSLHEAWKAAGGENFNPKNPDKKILKKYMEINLRKMKGLVGDKKIPLQGKAFSDTLNALTDTAWEGYEKGNKKSHKSFLKSVNEIAKSCVSATGASEHITVQKIGKAEEFTTNIRMRFRDKAEAAVQIFLKETPQEAEAKIKNLCKFSTKRALWGILPSIALAVSLQGIITGVTKLITGKKGFTGYKDFTEKKAEAPKAENAKKQKKPGLLKKKALAIAGMVGLTLLTTGAFGKNGIRAKGLKGFLKNFEIKDKFAHLDVMRLAYGSVLIGRSIKARDEAELKTATIRDYSGFLNWLVLGPFVAKSLATAFAPELLNISDPKPAKGIIKKIKHWLGDVHFKAPDEVLKTGKYNLCRASGLAWSLFALGIGMPLLLNKYVIDKAGKKGCNKEIFPSSAQSLKNANDRKNSFVSFMKNNKPSLLTKYNNFSNIA